ncbi:MAG: UbiA family prenyltransferase [candidate division WOR-3 bacterium]|nr:UbiA family prenyltransferase [candidate division WOR-3 bacterium]MCX7947030.1 UbiA family prenyltransferase [candidate division WOR-3 bacterium]MDW8149929.1 UbiA family prenyltransferase [candidate division WOR-3 bacterium]
MIKKIIEYIENTSFLSALVIALLSPIIRGVLEGAVDHNRMLTNPIEYKSALFIFLHQYAFFFAVYLVLSSIIKLFFPYKSTINIIKIVFSFSIIIITPPIVDAIFGGNFRPQYIFSFEEFLYSLFNLFNPFVELRALSPGMRIELLVAVLGIFLWSFAWGKSILKSTFIVLIFLITTGVIGSFPSFISREYFKTFSLIETDTQRYALINLYFIILSLIFLFPHHVKNIFKMRIYKFLYYLPFLVFGFIIGLKVVRFTYQSVFSNIFDFLGIFNIILCLFLTFLIALIVNDYFDREIDKINQKRNVFNEGILKENEFFGYISILTILNLSIALSTSYSIFVIILVILSSSILYSIEPVRLKRFWIISTLNLSFIALMSVVLAIGYFYKENPILILNEKLVLSILFGISLGFGLKDMSDVEGDKRGNIFTAYTMFGSFGKYVQGILASLSFVIVSLLLNINILIGLTFSILCFLFAIQKKFYEILFLILFGIFSFICFLKIMKESNFFRTVHYNYSKLEIVQFRDFKKLSERLNEILREEPCNEDVRARQIGLLYDLKEYEKVDSVARYLLKNCYMNGYMYHIWALALWKLDKRNDAMEKLKVSVLLSENDAYWTFSAMYYLIGNNLKSNEYRFIAEKKRARNRLARTLFNK